MPDKQAHIIHTLKYDIQFRNAEANKQEETISKLHHDHLAGVLGEIFDKYSPEGKHVFRDTVEIDLGVIPWGDFIQVFKSRLIVGIDECLSGLAVKDSESVSHVTHTQETAQDDDFRIVTPGEHKILALIHFLKKGYFSWQYTAKEISSVNDLFQEAFEKDPAQLSRSLHKLITRESVALKRFLLQIKPELQLVVFKKLFKDQLPVIIQIDAMSGLLSEKLGMQKQDAHELSLKVKEVFIGNILQKKQFKSADTFIRDNMQELGSTFKALIETGKADINKITFKKEENPILYALLKVAANIRSTEEKKAGLKKASREKKHDIEMQTDLPDEEKQAGKKEYKKKDHSKSEYADPAMEAESMPVAEITSDEEIEKGIMASNAGLVLLWPYLTRLFDEFDMLEGNEFRGEEEQMQAIFMLNYLAGNDSERSEDQLLVAKILCGTDLTTPLPAYFELKPEIRKECDNLLMAAIRNWKALKATSAHGLQETFLQRKALIKSKKDHYEFLFERKGADILIDRLPFGLSIVNFKWTQYHIRVIW